MHARNNQRNGVLWFSPANNRQAGLGSGRSSTQCPQAATPPRTIARGRFVCVPRRELASLVIEQAFQMLADNVRGPPVAEALFVPPAANPPTPPTPNHLPR